MSKLRTTALFEQALEAEGVTGTQAQLARSIYSQESSGGRNTATSSAGARGGMQIIPSTFKSVADKGWSVDNPLHNARAGIRYIKDLSNKAGGDPWLTAVGYYSGPGGMAAARKGVARRDADEPNAPNTFQYANAVVARAGMQPMMMAGTAGGGNPAAPTLTAEDIWGPEEGSASDTLPAPEVLAENTPAGVAPQGAVNPMEAFNAMLANNYAAGVGNRSQPAPNGSLGLADIGAMPDMTQMEPVQNFDMGLYKRA